MGEEAPLSKNALKKKLKAEAAAIKKAEKERLKAEQAAANPKKSKANVEEEILDPTQYKLNRENQIVKLESEGINPYPHKFHVQHRIPDYVAKYDPTTTDGERLEESVSIAGRIVSVRGQGKLFFYDLRGDGEKVQVMSDLKTYSSEEGFSKVHRMIKSGDIIGVTGYPGKSKKGELSIFPTEITLLSPCLHMLPFSKGTSSMGGLKDMETRFRQRYLDLIVNEDVRKT